jgi:hypothetical protein
LVDSVLRVILKVRAVRANDELLDLTGEFLAVVQVEGWRAKFSSEQTPEVGAIGDGG